MTVLYVIGLLLLAGFAIYAWIGCLYGLRWVADQILTRTRERKRRKLARMAQ